MTTSRRELQQVENVGSALFVAALVFAIVYGLDTAGHGRDRALWGGLFAGTLIAWVIIRSILELATLYRRTRHATRRRRTRR